MTRELLNAFLIVLGHSVGRPRPEGISAAERIHRRRRHRRVAAADHASRALPLAFWLPVINVPFVFIGYRYLGTAFASAARWRLVRSRPSCARAVSDGDTGSPARRRLRRILSRRGHRPGGARRRGARRHRDRGAAHQQAQHAVARRRRHSRIQRRRCFSSPWRCSASRPRCIRSSPI